MSVCMRDPLWVLEDVRHLLEQNTVLTLDLSETLYTKQELDMQLEPEVGVI